MHLKREQLFWFVIIFHNISIFDQINPALVNRKRTDLKTLNGRVYKWISISCIFQKSASRTDLDSSPPPGHRHTADPSRWRSASVGSRTLCLSSDLWPDRSPPFHQKCLEKWEGFIQLSSKRVYIKTLKMNRCVGLFSLLFTYERRTDSDWHWFCRNAERERGLE